MRRMLSLFFVPVFLLSLLFFGTLSFAIAGPEADFMVGAWTLRPAGDQEEGPAAITLFVRMEEGRLAGTAVIPIEGGEKRWPLVDPRFDGKTFTFKVDNGEMLLEGEMELVGEAFEGNWKSGSSDLGGRLTMTRKTG